MAAAIVLYWVAFALAPLLAHVFSAATPDEVFRVLAIVLVIRGVGLVPGAMIERELVFGSRAKGELSGTIMQAFVASPLAISGFGVWSLVAGQLAGQAVQTVVFWVVTTSAAVPTTLQLPASCASSAGSDATSRPQTSSSSSTQTSTLPPVGRLLQAADVGYYNMAWRLANLPATGIGYIIGRVMFPVYATLQDDRAAFQEAFLSNVRRVALFSLPVGVGIFLAAHRSSSASSASGGSRQSRRFEILAVFGLIRAFSGATAPAFQAAGKPHLLFVINSCISPSSALRSSPSRHCSDSTARQAPL